MNKRILIKGANFVNKGAEAMIFTCVSEICKKNPNCTITALLGDYNTGDINQENLKFNLTKEISFASIFYYLGGIFKPLVYIFMKLKNKKIDKSKIELFKTHDILVDVSGYALSSQWNFTSSLFYLLYIKLMKKNKIKVFLMPQSFGPFNYGGIKELIINYYIKKYMPYCEKIYAREQEGYDLLTQKYNLKNVEKTTDIVLQSKNIDYSYIFKKLPHIEDLQIKESSVAIIPNVRVFERANNIECLKFYQTIIDKELLLGNNIILIYHSTEDKEICNEIKNLYKSDDCVDIINKELSSFEYSFIVGKFKYIIASRYHSIVHAYKEIIPSITIGWAIKYKELMKIFNQEKYCVDIRTLEKSDDFIYLVDDMEKKLRINKEMINSKLKEVQKNNCFKIFD